MSFNTLTSLSPLDGRYAAKVDALRAQFSEFGLIRRRLQVEIEWLKALAAEAHFAEIPAFSAAMDSILLPRNASWSKSTGVMTAISGSMTLVASRRPPSPTSRTTISIRARENATNAMAVTVSKKLG